MATKWSSSEPLRTGGRHASQAPTDNPGIRQSHVTILVGISGDDLDWGFSCAGSDTDTNRPELLPTANCAPWIGLRAGFLTLASNWPGLDAFVHRFAFQSEQRASQVGERTGKVILALHRDGVFSAGGTSVYFLQGVTP